jgi:hypothetical protein
MKANVGFKGTLLSWSEIQNYEYRRVSGPIQLTLYPE